MFLIKMAFWLCVIVALVPINAGPSSVVVATKSHTAEPISKQAVGAARATVSDMASFCDRNPDVCRTGTAVLDRFATKAILVAGYVFDVISGARSDPAQLSTPRAASQSVGARQGTPAPLRPSLSQDALSSSDRAAPWVGPVDGDA